jgi:hypothetical protein
MRLPSPSYREYVEFVSTVVVTIAVFQYLDILGSAGAIDLVYLAGLAVVLPACTYLLTVAGANVAWIPQWDRMVQSA